jgi:hypothetical protein
MTDNLKAALNHLIELAKIEFGEYREEIIGYEKGEYIGNDIFWSDEILSLSELQKNDEYGMPSDKDIFNRQNSSEQYYWYGNNFVIAKRVKILNEGWQIKLLKTINSIK